MLELNGKTYIVCCYYACRITTYQFELHAEPPKSVPLFCLESTSYLDTFYKVYIRMHNKCSMKCPWIEVVWCSTCVFVEREVPDLTILGGSKMLFRPHYTEVVVEGWCFRHSCFRWKTISNHDDSKNEKNLGRWWRNLCVHWWWEWRTWDLQKEEEGGPLKWKTRWGCSLNGQHFKMIYFFYTSSCKY